MDFCQHWRVTRIAKLLHIHKKSLVGDGIITSDCTITWWWYLVIYYYMIILFFSHKAILFKSGEPLLPPQSIQYANDTDGKTRIRLYDHFYSHTAMKDYYNIFKEVRIIKVMRYDILVWGARYGNSALRKKTLVCLCIPLLESPLTDSKVPAKWYHTTGLSHPVQLWLLIVTVQCSSTLLFYLPTGIWGNM